MHENGWSPLTVLHTWVVLDKSSDKSVTYLAIKDSKKTALHFAANRHHIETVKLLLSHSADCCEQGNNFLHFAAMSKRPFAIDGSFSNDNKLRVGLFPNDNKLKSGRTCK